MPKERRYERADRTDVLEHPRGPRPHLRVVAVGLDQVDLVTLDCLPEPGPEVEQQAYYRVYRTVTVTVVNAESATSYMHQPRTSILVTGGFKARSRRARRRSASRCGT
jgi:hypothetical protein